MCVHGCVCVSNGNHNTSFLRIVPDACLPRFHSLAMLSIVGFVAQHAANTKSPLAALGEHISNPWTDNFATNGEQEFLLVSVGSVPI